MVDYLVIILPNIISLFIVSFDFYDVRYIMTSEHTKDSTQRFFADHDHFGLNPNDIVFFEQAMIPCLDFQGRILLDQKGKISRAPGN